MSAWVKKLPVVAITLALTIALTPAAAAYAFGVSTGAVNGVVKSANTGAALADVTVRVFDMNDAKLVAEAVTDEQGAITLAELPLGLYQVTVIAPDGYAGAAGPLVHLTADDPEASVAFNLEARPGTQVAAGGGGLLALFTNPFVLAGIAGAIIGTTAIILNDDDNVGTQ